jgi:MFS family permease
VIGLSNALDNLLGALYALPGGYLSDRLGYKRALILFDLVTALGYLIVILFPSWQAALVGAVLFTSWGSVSLPAIMSAVAKSLPSEKRTMGVSMHSLLRRIPMALGPVLCGLLIARWGEREGIRIAFMLSLAIAIASLFIQQLLIHEEPPGRVSSPPTAGLRELFSGMSVDLRRLLLSDILIRFCEQIPYAFVVIWCIRVIGVSPVEFGFLSTIEMVTAVLVYVPVAYLVERQGRKKPFIAITFGFFSLFPLVLLFSRSLPALAFAFFVRGLKEFGEPTRKSLILDFAQGPRQGTLYGAYYMARDTIVSLAAFGGGFLWSLSPQANFLVAFAFGIAGTAYFLRYCRE